MIGTVLLVALAVLVAAMVIVTLVRKPGQSTKVVIRCADPELQKAIILNRHEIFIVTSRDLNESELSVARDRGYQLAAPGIYKATVTTSALAAIWNEPWVSGVHNTLGDASMFLSITTGNTPVHESLRRGEWPADAKTPANAN